MSRRGLRPRDLHQTAGVSDSFHDGGWEPLPLRPDRRVPRPAVAAALLVVAGVAVLAYIALRGGGSDHPAAWDERVVDLVAFVEQERGLEFDHPVAVEFLSDDEFRAEVTRRDEPDEEQLAELESIQAMMRAVGLLSGDVDLLEIGDELQGEGTVGFYSFDDERIVVRGRRLDDQRRLTLVHELTHALQDQHFGLGDLDTDTSGESAGYLAVVEADAELVKEAWEESLSADERAALDEAEPGPDDLDFEGVPPVFVELMSFPYVFGPDFLTAVIDEEGQDGRDAVMDDLPTTEEHLILPETYLDRQEPAQVATPGLRDGEEPIEDSESDFGMLSLLVVLAERVDFAESWQAVQGWAGDAAIAFKRKGTTCVRVDVAFDTARQAEAFAAAFDQWADGRPATQEVDATRVLFESCDPGVDVDQERPEGQLSGIHGLGLRKGIIDSFITSGATRAQATCVADGLIVRIGGNRLLELDRLLLEQPDAAAGEEIRAVVTDLVAECR
jgi:hypothetical protein